MELAEDEVQNFFKVWAIVLVSLNYCYKVGNLTQKGYPRLFAILPIILLFLALPLKLTSFHLGGMTSFFIAWLANFKLLLFAFGKGPLCSSSSSISFPLFFALTCFPIRIQEENPQENYSKISQIGKKMDIKSGNKSDPSTKTSKTSKTKQDPVEKIKNNSYPSSQNTQKSPWNYIIKGFLLAIIIKIYTYNEYIHPKLMWFFFCFHMYFFLELALSLLAASVKFFTGFELEPPFNEPLLSSSLQDFWGRRWNIMVTRILRPTVYLPTLDFATKVVGRAWAPLPAVMATFTVSGIMHELIFYYLGRVPTTFQGGWFFLLHGVCLCAEVEIKKRVGGKWKVPRWISGPATMAFVLATGFWLFLPPLIRAGAQTRPLQEYAAVGKFVRNLQVLAF